MGIKFVFPFLAGLAIVSQGSLNRALANKIGLMSAAFLNALIFLALAGTLWLLMRNGVIGGGSALAPKTIVGLEWWAVLPGLCGFLIVISTPMAIGYLGANLTFAMIICTQLVVSLAWDSIAGGELPSLKSVMGVILMLFGAMILFIDKR